MKLRWPTGSKERFLALDGSKTLFEALKKRIKNPLQGKRAAQVSLVNEEEELALAIAQKIKNSLTRE